MCCGLTAVIMDRIEGGCSYPAEQVIGVMQLCVEGCRGVTESVDFRIIKKGCDGCARRIPFVGIVSIGLIRMSDDSID